MNRLERLLILLPWLAHHQGVSIAEVAAHFDISQEQVTQDLLLLSVTGNGQFYGEQFSVDVEDNCIYIDDALGLDRPVKFDAAEAAILILGLEALASLSANQDIQNAKAKLLSVLPMNQNLSILSSDTNVNAIIKNAIIKNQKIAFEYWNVGRGDLTSRIVSPLRVYFKDGVTSLDGYCHTTSHWKTFRTDRIQNVNLVDQDAESPDLPFTDMQFHDVILEVPKADSHILEEFTIYNREIHENAIRATVKVFGFDFIVRRIIAHGGAISVISPSELTDYVTQRANSALQVYGAETPLNK
jgi:proteasome accessory factor C